MNAFLLVLLAIFAVMTQQYYVEDRAGNLHHYGRGKPWVRGGSNAANAATNALGLYNTIRGF